MFDFDNNDASLKLAHDRSHYILDQYASIPGVDSTRASVLFTVDLIKAIARRSGYRMSDLINDAYSLNVSTGMPPMPQDADQPESDRSFEDAIRSLIETMRAGGVDVEGFVNGDRIQVTS